MSARHVSTTPLAKIHRNDELGLTNGARQSSFDALTRIAAHVLNVPVSLISIVEEDRDRHVFASQCGLPDDWAEARSTPLSHSFCQHVKRLNAPLSIPDARVHPLVKDNPSVKALDFVAYLGVPICGPDGVPLGALCVAQPQERAWTDAEIAALSDIAGCVSNEIALRAALLDTKALHLALENLYVRSQRYSSLRESIALNFMAPDISAEQRFDALLRSGREALEVDQAAIYRVDSDRAHLLFANSAEQGWHGPLSARVEGTLTGLVMSGQSTLHFNDKSVRHGVLRPDVSGRHPKTFISSPLILNGTMFGTIEFSSISPKAHAWTDEEQSVVGMISIFASASLEIFGLTCSLENRETALLQEVRAERERLLASSRPGLALQRPSEIAASTRTQDLAPL